MEVGRVPSVLNKRNIMPGAYVPPEIMPDDISPFSPRPFANHLIQGYHIGLYATPGEVLDHIGYVRREKEGVNALLPPDFEDTVLRSMGFARKRAHPALPYTIEEIPETAKTPSG